FAGLTIAKPNVVLLFGLAILLWGLDRRRWAVLGGSSITILLATATALIANPHVFQQYRQAMLIRPPSEMVPPVPGSLLRALGGVQHFWLGFFPLVPGVAWLLGYYLCRRRDWDWHVTLPWLAFACLFSTPYAWVYDFSLLVIPLLQMFGRQPADA